jgi:hypothetical protein
VTRHQQGHPSLNINILKNNKLWMRRRLLAHAGRTRFGYPDEPGSGSAEFRAVAFLLEEETAARASCHRQKK